MITEIEINTTIKSGLPVMARANYYTFPQYDNIILDDTIDDLEFFWPSGYQYLPEVSEADKEAVRTAMYDWYRNHYQGEGNGRQEG